MGGLRRGLVSLAIAGAVATGGFIGGLALSGGAATAATSSNSARLTGTPVAATASPSATPKSNESTAHEKQETAAEEKAENSGTARHKCPEHSGGTSSSTTSTGSNV
jgi:hypothetical protein